MAKLTTEQRNKIPTSKFALPSERKFPLEDAAHAKNAKSRAKAMLDAGRLSPSAYNRIIEKANAKLGRTNPSDPADLDDGTTGS